MRSSTDRFDEGLSSDTRLPEDATQRASFDLTMQWHDTTDRAATHHHMTPAPTHHGEAETLERPDGIRPRDVREFRQRRRCGTW